MTGEKKKSGIFAQILVTVVVALLVSGTSPWWWKEFKEFFGGKYLLQKIGKLSAESGKDLTKRV